MSVNKPHDKKDHFIYSLWSIVKTISCPTHGKVWVKAFYDEWEIIRFMEDDEGEVPCPLCDAEIAGIQ